ncbi:chaplin [Streptomyces sp. ISL-66]|uniref:chaplin n=1 Tax=Streptomyces sp. ISL-66 TaxID=2819186 RepID=UPI001BECCD44|nr:chaplin [Streptomyces sp. ISL-66]MBT2467979.1 chaplin [Streptomyces sp. ISL-66]
MRHSRRNGLIAAVVAGGGLAVAGVGGLAHADANAGGQAERSPGLLSGNLVQLPVHTPVNVCGNTVSVIGVLNSAAGNRCANENPGGGHSGKPGNSGPRPSHPSSRSPHSSKPGAGNGGGNGGGAEAHGHGKDSPGLLSGNGLQLPVDLPVNISGNAVSVVGVGNSSVGNTSVNGEPPAVSEPVRPPAVVRPVTPPAPPQGGPSALAHTGADGVGYLMSGGGVLLLGGVLLYRRFRLS